MSCKQWYVDKWNWTWVSCVAGGFFTIWATREAHLRTSSVKINNTMTHKSWFVAFADFKATKLMSLNVELEIRISIHGWLNAQMKNPWIWGWTETFYKGLGHLQILEWGEGSWYQFLMDTEGWLSSFCKGNYIGWWEVICIVTDILP